MLIYATVTAHSRGLLGLPAYAWTLTDRQLIQLLLQCDDADISETVRSWLVNNPWPLSDLLWMRSPVPQYSQLYDFSKVVGQAVGRQCFPYRIVDKRVRKSNTEAQVWEDTPTWKPARQVGAWDSIPQAAHF